MKARSKAAPAAARAQRGQAAPAKAARAGGKPHALQERLAALERERDELREELERANARQRRLEEVHAQVRDRIAWALDSLQSILAGKSQ
jgi:hypothetical protein